LSVEFFLIASFILVLSTIVLGGVEKEVRKRRPSTGRLLPRRLLAR